MFYNTTIDQITKLQSNFGIVNHDSHSFLAYAWPCCLIVSIIPSLYAPRSFLAWLSMGKEYHKIKFILWIKMFYKGILLQ